MQITNTLQINGNHVGYLVEMDGVSIGFTKKGIYRLIKELHGSYNFYDFNGDIEDLAGNKISELPPLEWNENIQPDYEQAKTDEFVLREPEIVQYYAVRNNTQFVEVNRPATTEIHSRQELLEYVKRLHKLKIMVGTTGKHEPWSHICDKEVLFTVKELLEANEYEKTIIQMEEDRNISDEEIKNYKSMHKEARLNAEILSYYNESFGLGDIFEVYYLMDSFMKSGVMEEKPISQITELDLISAITAYGYPILRSDNVISMEIDALPGNAFVIPRNGVAINEQYKTSSVGILDYSDPLDKVITTENGKNYPLVNANDIGGTSLVSIYQAPDIVRGIQNKGMQNGKSLSFFKVSEQRNIPMFKMRFIEDGVRYTAVLSPVESFIYIDATQEVIHSSNSTYTVVVPGMGVMNLSYALDQKKMIRRLLAMAYGGRFSEEYQSTEKIKSTVSWLSELGLWAGSALKLGCTLTTTESTMCEDNNKQYLKDKYFNISMAYTYYKEGLEGLVRSIHETDNACSDAIYSKLSEDGIDDPTQDDVMDVIRFYHQSLIELSAKTADELTAEEREIFLGANNLFNNSNVGYKFLFADDFLNQSVNTGYLGEGIYTDNNIRLDGIVGVITAYLNHTVDDSLQNEMYVSECVKQLQSFLPNGQLNLCPISNINSVLIKKSGAEIGSMRDIYEIKSRNAKANYYLNVIGVVKEPANVPMEQRRDIGVLCTTIDTQAAGIQTMLANAEGDFRAAIDDEDNMLTCWKDGKQVQVKIPDTAKEDLPKKINATITDVISKLIHMKLPAIEVADKLLEAQNSGRPCTELMDTEQMQVTESYQFVVDIPIPDIYEQGEDSNYIFKLNLDASILTSIQEYMKVVRPVDYISLADLAEKQFNSDATTDTRVLNAFISPWRVLPLPGESLRYYNFHALMMSNDTIMKVLKMTSEEFVSKYDVNNLRPAPFTLTQIQTLKINGIKTFFEYDENFNTNVELLCAGIDMDAEPDYFAQKPYGETVAQYGKRWARSRRLYSTLKRIKSKSDYTYAAFADYSSGDYLAEVELGADDQMLFLKDLNSFEYTFNENDMWYMEEADSSFVEGNLFTNTTYVREIIDEYLKNINGDMLDMREQAARDIVKQMGYGETGTKLAMYLAFTNVLEPSILDDPTAFNNYTRLGRILTRPDTDSCIINKGSIIERRRR